MTYDVLVIGAGSGGLAAAKAAAAQGAKVAIAEPKQLGGTCVNRGCIPKKFIVQAATFCEQQQIARSHGWQDLKCAFDWSALKSAMTQQLEQIRQSQQQTLQEAGIEILSAAGQFVDPHTVAVGDREVKAQNIIIAVGGQPMLPDMPGIDLALTSDDMFQLEHLPARMITVGGGYIGVEFSCMMAQLGVQVTLIDTDAQVLSGFDDDLRTFMQASIEHLGINFIPETTCKEISANSSGLTASLSGEHSQDVEADAVLMAVGRKPKTESLGLAKADIELNEGYIKVDDYGQTSQPSVYAIGDCVGRLPLTPVAIAEGEAVVKTICKQQPTTADYRWIPSAVFGMPPLASAGWSEAKAKKQTGDSIEIVRHKFTPLSHSLVESPQKSFLKLVLAKSSHQILGVHAAGKYAPNTIQGLVPALRKGLTFDELNSTIGIHPTSAEEIFSPN